MKRIFAYFLVTVLALATIVSSALAGGGPMPLPAEVQSQLTDEQLKQMAEAQKKAVNELVFYFNPADASGASLGEAKYIFNVVVTDGAYDAKMQGIEVGRYSVNVYANANGGQAFKDEQIILEVISGQTATLSVNLKLGDYMLIPLKIPVTSGSFDEGGSYEVKLSGEGSYPTFSSGGSAQYSQGQLSLSIYAYQPYLTSGRVSISITDKLGNQITNTYSVNIMDVVANNWQPIILTPPPSGNVNVDIKFAYEEASILKLNMMPLSDNVLRNGTNVLFRVKMSAGTARDVDVFRQTYIFYKSLGLTISNPRIVDEASGIVFLLTDFNSAGEYSFNFPSALTIPVGISKGFALMADVSGVSPGSNITTQMVSDQSAIKNLTAAQASDPQFVGETNNNFVWSDRSANPHSLNSADWQNSYAIGWPIYAVTLSNK